MADVPGHTLVVAESVQTHTPPDPRAGALVLAQGHAEELRQRRHNQPPPALARSVQRATPRAHDSASDARGRARQVQRDIVNEGNEPP